jgi:acetyl-CoA carboxylase biotin carboxyl carrier protein
LPALDYSLSREWLRLSLITIVVLVSIAGGATVSRAAVSDSRLPEGDKIGNLKVRANMNLREVKELIELVSEKGFAEFEIEHQGFRLHICRFKEPPIIQAAPAPVIISSVPGVTESQTHSLQREAVSVAPARPSQAETPSPEIQLHTIKSPIVGTFFRSPSPTSDSFVRIGDHVETDTVVCIIEAMKLMNEIQAETSGEIVKIYVENGQPVEYGQPLFGIKT